MKKILIIEDDKSIASELEQLLNNSGYLAIAVEDFKNVLENILKTSPDLILLDINIPYINGEVLLKELRKESNIPVIMVTSKNTEVDEVLSMSYGADDYITKPYNPTILLLRIAAILKRTGRQLDSLVYRELSVDIGKGLLTKGSEQIVLTKNEMIIFRQLLNNQGNIVSRDDIMTNLWNNNEFINDNALTVNISRLRSKLKSIGYEDAIETRKGQGYVLI
ncbi:response regulator transcription factor [Clostridium sp. MSJ-8]|uniref:response regulator transcription factor n=1 Tax=Clostridium sp. MSJ-8 TaxID=2841510 RepID=UPI001C0F08F8|nr:response regulator transcription factor [Clostridium sp. MSJ-8]MBU5486901.1 response regulator transcription factor [Clostridium sp. MSJ-8]